MSGLFQSAYMFMVAAHEAVGQKRKYTEEPYIIHPLAVAGKVVTVTRDVEVVAAALLHDVVEDTKITNETIHMFFGGRVARLVFEVTDVSKKEDGNRATRKALDRAHLAQASPEGKTIKLADILDNGKDIQLHDPKFANRYMSEIQELLPHLKEGDPRLYKEAEQMIESYFQALQPIAVM